MFERSTADARPDDQPVHRCVAGPRCKASVIENDVKRPAFTEQPDTLCDGCTAHHQSAVKRLTRDYAMLRVTLGERQSRHGETVTSSPTPVILIDATSDRLITELLEWSSYAADLIAEQLGTYAPDGARKLAHEVHLEDRVEQLQEGSLADRTWEATHPTDAQRLTAYTSSIDTGLHLLAAYPPHDVQVWSQPHRCDDHAAQVAAAKQLLHLARQANDQTEINDAIDALQAAHAEAGICTQCCGWSDDGRSQARQTVTMSGLDVLERLTRTHHLIRQHLGHTKLRVTHSMPCPNCGSTLGQDDGSNVVDCGNQKCTPRGPSSWTEREYQFLSGMIVDDIKTSMTTRWLLTEAYSRLDGLQKLVDDLAADERFNDAPAVKLILDAVKPHLAGHLTPDARRIATAKADTVKRQAIEDNWAWKREPRYTKPKTKPRKPVRDDVPKYAQSSLTTITDVDESIVDQLRIGDQTCPACHLVHRGDCP